MASSRRTALVEASWRAIARHGVRNFRIEQVAEDAGVSIGLIYYHFGSRDGLLNATMEYANEIPGSMRTEVAKGATGYDQLQRSLTADFAGSQQSRDNAVVWHELVAASVFEEGVRGQVQATLDEWRRGIVDLVARGQGDGSIRADVDAAVLARTVTALVDGLLAHIVVGSLSWDSARSTLEAAVARLAAPDSIRWS